LRPQVAHIVFSPEKENKVKFIKVSVNMSVKAVNILNRFKNTLVQFLDDLIETFPRHESFVAMRILVKDQISPIIIMEGFLEDLDHIDKQVSVRSNEFFCEDNPVFAKLGASTEFSQIWFSEAMDEENRNVMWLWIEDLTKLAKLYKAANIASAYET
jgi:hypothetical protein